MNRLKQLFNVAVNGALPATTITTVEKVLDNMFTIVKMVGETATIKLHESLGGLEFDVKWHWQLVQNDDGSSFFTEVWDSFPESARHCIAEYVKNTLPDSHFVYFMPDAAIVHEFMNSTSVVVDHAAKTIEFAGKVFQLDGFVVTIIISICVKTLFRLVVDRRFSLKKFAQDVATAGASGFAVYGTKFVLISTIAHPPLALVWGASAIVGVVCAVGAKSLMKESTLNK